MSNGDTSLAEPKQAATIILVRDVDDGLEVFMVARNYQVDSFSGALVFPGGKLDCKDSSAEIRLLCRDAELYGDDQLALRVASVREAFEESGILLARDSNSGEFPTTEKMLSLGRYRESLEQGGIDLVTILQQENLELAVDYLEHFSNWLTPKGWPAKRFDTHFFVAKTPKNYSLIHDGSETVASLWGTPEKLMSEADKGRWNIVFPTRANLSRLNLFASTDDLLSDCRRIEVDKIEPLYEQFSDSVKVSVPEDAGYPFRELEIKNNQKR